MSVTPKVIVSAAGTNAQVVRSTPGSLRFLSVSNNAAALRYLQIYDTNATPNVGTDVPVMKIVVPGSTTGGVSNVVLPLEGIPFANGIAIAMVATSALNSVTGMTADELVVSLGHDSTRLCNLFQ